MPFLILELVGCASAPRSTKFDGKWELYDLNPMEPPKACLSEADTLKLRKILIQCGSESGQ